MKLREFIEYSETLDDTANKIELFERVIRITDPETTVPSQITVRKYFIETCIGAGNVDKAVAAFGWCIQQADENPKLDQAARLLPVYRQVIIATVDLPAISRRQIQDMADDLEKRLLELNKSLHHVHYVRLATNLWMGHFQAAHESFERMVDCVKNPLQAKRLVHINRHIELIARLGRHEEAIQLANAKLANDESSIRGDFSALLLAAMHLGRIDEARRYHQLGWSEPKLDRVELYNVSFHLLFLVRVRELDEAKQVFLRHAAWIDQAPNLGNQFHFYCASYVLLKQIAKNEPVFFAILPKQVAPFHGNVKHQTEELATWFKTNAEEIAAVFDQRNESNFFADTIDEFIELADIE